MKLFSSECSISSYVLLKRAILLSCCLETNKHDTEIFMQSSEDEALIRKVLYDAVILVDYSFLNPERTAYLPADRVRKLALAKLLVTHDGVLYFRYVWMILHNKKMRFSDILLKPLN